MNEDILPIFNEIFNNKFIYSESDIISMYIDGRIDKDEYIRRMNSLRNSSK